MKYATIADAACAIALLVPAMAAQCLAADQSPAADPPVVRAETDVASGQVLITDAGQPVLRYNYKTVDPPDGYLEKVNPGARKYAVARSDYIHPLYGLDGEVLTADWSIDHPHHRGIYWAWPEVDFGSERGDLHALQRVFARPTGNIQLTAGPDFAQVEAENVWKWEEKTPIAREVATIRAFHAGQRGRLVDLRFAITALADGVTLARRGTDKYGGLNVRLSPVKDLKLSHHADPAGAVPRRAWSESIGIREGGTGLVGLTVFEKATNPDYPGDWINYPGLPWFQPTFPAAGTRYALKKDSPLVLEYRLWVHRGGEAAPADYAAQWDAFNRPPQDEPKRN